ncbi:hypothetical protein GGI42DRAFT_176975 [Trichoderma sp. SZMC 28013]
MGGFILICYALRLCFLFSWTFFFLFCYSTYRLLSIYSTLYSALLCLQLALIRHHGHYCNTTTNLRYNTRDTTATYHTNTGSDTVLHVIQMLRSTQIQHPIKLHPRNAHKRRGVSECPLSASKASRAKSGLTSPEEQDATKQAPHADNGSSAWDLKPCVTETDVPNQARDTKFKIQ